MPTPREQGGRLSEASRLLQEGLELLDQRTREDATGNIVRISVPHSKNCEQAILCLITFRRLALQVVAHSKPFRLLFRTLFRFALTNCMS